LYRKKGQEVTSFVLIRQKAGRFFLRSERRGGGAEQYPGGNGRGKFKNKMKKEPKKVEKETGESIILEWGGND